MCTVDGEHLELFAVQVPHPARNIRGLSIRGIDDRVSIRRQACLTRWKPIERPKREPRFISCSSSTHWRKTNGRKKIAHDGHGQYGAGRRVEGESDLCQQ